MRVGIPKEIKVLEGRVGLVPDACASLVRGGHTVYVQQSAGELSGYADSAFVAAGAVIVPDAAAVYGQSELIVKVKEPVGPELDLLQAHHLLFSYLHLAAEPVLAQRLLDIGLTGVAFETVEEQGRLPLLAPMSDIAGRISVQVGANLLQHVHGGKGLLLGGLPCAERGNVVVIGAGVAGGAAATMAAAMGANVTVFDLSRDKLERMRALGPNVTGLYPYPAALEEAARKADLLVGAILLAGERASFVVSAETVGQMAKGSVIVDISVDQGGCIETTRPTNYAAPTYVERGVVHFCVTNMPGAVPRSASQALSAATLPFAAKLASGTWRDDARLVAGVNVEAGRLIHPGLVKSLKSEGG